MLQFGKKLDGISYRDRPGAYAIAFNPNNQVAVIQTKKGFFLPGGGLDDGESEEAALSREIFEETGRPVVILKEIGRAAQYMFVPSIDQGNQGFNKIGVFYLAELKAATQSPSEEGHDLLWMSPGEANGKLNHEYQRWAVELAVRARGF